MTSSLKTSEVLWAESIDKALEQGFITEETIANLPPIWREVFDRYKAEQLHVERRPKL